MRRNSKTTILCDCHWFKLITTDPASPIKFDPAMNEYNLVYEGTNGGESRYLFYHCPFCGGKTPESKRALLFTHPTEVELQRLEELTDSLETVGQVLQKLGPPDEDIAVPQEAVEMMRTMPGWEEGDTGRELRYSGLSDTATVGFKVFEEDTVKVYFVGKYIGPPIDEEAN